MAELTLKNLHDEISNTKIEYYDLNLRKFKHSTYSKIEPNMDDSDYQSLVEDIKMNGRVHTPVIIYNNEVLDGRTRQRAAIELDIKLPVKKLDGKYNTSILSEFVRSIHMNRNKSKTQKEIQAFRYKQTVANIEWPDAATKYGVKERSVQRINTLYNRLKDAGLESDFDKIVNHFEYNLMAKPGEFSWINKATGTFSGALNQLKTYIELQEDSGKKGDLDLTEINPETGEYLDKMENIHLKAIQNNLTLEEKLEQVIKENQELKEKISELENSIN